MENNVSTIIRSLGKYFLRECEDEKQQKENMGKAESVVQKQTTRLTKYGDFSFPTTHKGWAKQLSPKGMESIREESFDLFLLEPEHAKEHRNARIRLAEITTRWQWPLARLRIDGERCALFLHRQVITANVMQHLLQPPADVAPYGQLRKNPQRNISVKQLSEGVRRNIDYNLSFYRAKLVRDVLLRVLEYSEWNVFPDPATVNDGRIEERIAQAQRIEALTRDIERLDISGNAGRATAAYKELAAAVGTKEDGKVDGKAEKGAKIKVGSTDGGVAESIAAVKEEIVATEAKAAKPWKGVPEDVGGEGSSGSDDDGRKNVPVARKGSGGIKKSKKKKNSKKNTPVRSNESGDSTEYDDFIEFEYTSPFGSPREDSQKAKSEPPVAMKNAFLDSDSSVEDKQNVEYVCGGVVRKRSDVVVLQVLSTVSKSFERNVRNEKNADITLVCGMVVDPATARKAMMEVDEYHKMRKDYMRLLSMHKHGLRLRNYQLFLRLVECLGSAAVKIDLLEAKPSSPVNIQRFSQGSTKGSAFILYNSARIDSLLRTFDDRVKTKVYDPLPDVTQVDWALLDQEEEWELIFGYICAFPDLIERCLDQLDRGFFPVHLIVQFICGFMRVFSTYYRRVRVLTPSREHLMPTVHARIYLVKVVQAMLKRSLALLDIQPVPAM